MVPLSNKVLWFYIIIQKKRYDLKPNEKPESYPPPHLSAHYKLYFSYELLLSLSLIQISPSIYKCLASKHQLRQLVIIISSNTDEFIRGVGWEGKNISSFYSGWAGIQHL